jgi:hypothetical protein
MTDRELSLAQAWDSHAEEWIAWTRTPGHDSYETFHRNLFLHIVARRLG